MKYNKYLFVITGITTLVYLSWRVVFTIPWHGTPFALIFGFFLWVSECVSALTGMVLIWTKQKYKETKIPSVDGHAFPHIDVFIATHNEDVDILYKTVNACVNMMYPDKRKVHIYIADDTNRTSIRKLAASFGVGYIGLEDNKHAKSGNLNHALAHTHSPLIATFDADMIPYSNFLMETVPYFIHESDMRFNHKIGFVQTPQSFYNADVFHFNLYAESSVPNEQDFFSREVNILNTAHNAAVYTGSNTVISRQAIMDAGGFPTNTITEDFQLGATINSLGYTSIATQTPLASGLTPTQIKSVLKQRTRWARGVIQSIYNLRILSNSKFTRSQKIVYLTNFLYWWSFARRLMYIIAPILFTVFDIRVVETDFWILLIFWLPSYVLQTITMAQVSSAIRTQRWGEIYETILAPYLVIPVFLETIGMKQRVFKVTSKKQNHTKREVLFVVPHLVLLILAVYGLVRFNYGKFGSELFYGSVINFWLVHHIINLFFAVFFSLGRPIMREYERFFVQEQVIVTTPYNQYKGVTQNISEGGISFSLSVPMYLCDDDIVVIDLKSKGYHATLKGKRVRVLSEENAWTYMIALGELDESNKRQYLQIIHDRSNDFLPKHRDVWMTSFDELWHVFTSRYAHHTQPQQPLQRMPMVSIQRTYHVEGVPITMDIFDYEYMTMRVFSTWDTFPNFKIPLRHTAIQLEFDDFDRQQGIMRYRVMNTQELAKSPNIEHELLHWRQSL